MKVRVCFSFLFNIGKFATVLKKLTVNVANMWIIVGQACWSLVRWFSYSRLLLRRSRPCLGVAVSQQKSAFLALLFRLSRWEEGEGWRRERREREEERIVPCSCCVFGEKPHRTPFDHSEAVPLVNINSCSKCVQRSWCPFIKDELVEHG